ncbi:hypothetical protein VV02_00835 [Luteipulveratus mongoliensis]|uniref:Uncharacterized protein n=1 Tax=Luteipulveratus mongoliensis TaxID=571913 RepID=A0A0K1JDI7_9MICO|nr:hypothetical protein VV02_00835 [Luteipulveratus mongoliensis]
MAHVWHRSLSVKPEDGRPRWSVTGPTEDGRGVPRPAGRYGADLTLPRLCKAHGRPEQEEAAAAEWVLANDAPPSQDDQPVTPSSEWEHPELEQLADGVRDDADVGRHSSASKRLRVPNTGPGATRGRDSR